MSALSCHFPASPWSSACEGGQIENPTRVDDLHRRVMEITGRDPLPYGIAPNRQTLEEMNEIAIALERCSQLAIGFNRMPQSLQELVPNFLAEVPHTSPLGTPYVYQAENTHYTLRAALPGSGEIRLEDGALTRLPAGALTEKCVAGAAETVVFAVPVIVAVTVSVAVIVCAPFVVSVTLKMCEPASPPVKV